MRLTRLKTNFSWRQWCYWGGFVFDDSWVHVHYEKRVTAGAACLIDGVLSSLLFDWKNIDTPRILVVLSRTTALAPASVGR